MDSIVETGPITCVYQMTMYLTTWGNGGKERGGNLKLESDEDVGWVGGEGLGRDRSPDVHQ